MEVTEFMDINGDKIFDTKDGWNYVSEGYSMEEPDDLPLELVEDFEIDESQFMTAELVKAQLSCKTYSCGGTTTGKDDYCYYCQKKQAGLIEGDYPTLEEI